MHMGYNNTCPEYFLNGTKLENVSEEKDLGDSGDASMVNSAFL